MPMKNVTLPFYTRTEEILNGVTHGLGVLIGLFSLFYLNGKALSVSAVSGAMVFSLCVIVLYSFSTIYHSVTNEGIKKIFRLIDHSSIYILISGTIIAICFICIYEKNRYIPIIATSVCSVLSILGITLTFINHEKYKNIQMILYLVIGWGAAALAYPLFIYCKNPKQIILNILAGGILYTVGTVFYKLGKKRRYFHSIFHVFVLGGTVFHLISIIIALQS